MDLIKSRIRDIPDFPKPGIIFKDITPVLGDPAAFERVIDLLVERHGGKGVEAVVGMESRGFIFGAPLALRMGLPFVPVRKVGKLPGDTEKVSYALEYGEATIEIHRDALTAGQKVLVVDDLLATGGTAVAPLELIDRLGAETVAIAFVIELDFLEGRKRLPEGRVDSLIHY